MVVMQCLLLFLQGEEVIAVIPWDEWWELQLKDESNPHIALLPLHPEVRAVFNETAAWDYVKSMVGKLYGYHNLIFSWIDTISDNYPPPLDASLVLIFAIYVLTIMHLKNYFLLKFDFYNLFVILSFSILGHA